MSLIPLVTWDRVNNIGLSIRLHWKKYSVVGLATWLAIVWVYKDFSHRVCVEELVSKSLLGQAAGLFHSDQVRIGKNGTVGVGSVAKSNNSIPGGVAISESTQKGPNYIPPEAEIVITPKDKTKTLDQVVNIKITNKFGFTLEPGLDLSAAPLGIGLDFKWLYAWKFGTEFGLEHYFGAFESNSPTVGMSYRLDSFRLLKNTELKINYVPSGKLPISAGIRVNF